MVVVLLYRGGSRYDFVDYRRHECGEQALRQSPPRAALRRVRERRLHRPWGPKRQERAQQKGSNPPDKGLVHLQTSLGGPCLAFGVEKRSGGTPTIRKPDPHPPEEQTLFNLKTGMSLHR